MVVFCKLSLFYESNVLSRILGLNLVLGLLWLFYNARCCHQEWSSSFSAPLLCSKQLWLANTCRCVCSLLVHEINLKEFLANR